MSANEDSCCEPTGPFNASPTGGCTPGTVSSPVCYTVPPSLTVLNGTREVTIAADCTTVSVVILDSSDVPVPGAVVAACPPSSGGGSIIVQDEGITVTSDATCLNFVGAGVTATLVGSCVEINIPGGGGLVFPITAPPGTCAAPSYSFAASPDSGMFYTGTSVRVSDDNCVDFVEVGSGVSVTTASVNRLTIASNGAWQLAGNAGTAGQVLTSNGVGGPPTWQAAAAVSFPLLAPNGSCAAPSYSFTASPDSGMFYTGTAVRISDDNCVDYIEVGASINIIATTSSVSIQGGAPATTVQVATAGVAITFGAGADLKVNADPGAAGEVLTSNGAGAAPTWQAGGASVTFPLLAPNGTCAAPSYSFTASPDSGMFYDPAGAGSVVIADDNCVDSITIGGTIAITTNSVLRHTYTAAGEWNVGGSVGAAGEVLTSNGAGLAPTWQASGAVVVCDAIDAMSPITPATAAMRIPVFIPGDNICATITVQDVCDFCGGGLTFPIAAPNGSCGAPSYSFTADAASGMFWDNAIPAVTIGFDGCDSVVQVGDDVGVSALIDIHLSTNTVERLRIDATGAWLLASVSGTAGQVLTSNGAGTPPTWQSVAGGSFPLTAPNGSCAAPSYSFTSSPDSGMFYTGTAVRVSDDNCVDMIEVGSGFAITTNSVLRATVTTAGEWNIGGSVGTAGQVLTSNGAAAAPTWQAAPGGAPTVTSITSASSPYAVLAGDQTILVDTIGGATTVTLPGAPTTGRKLIVKKTTTDINVLTIDRNGNQIEGAAANFTTAAAGRPSFELQYDGTTWWFI